MTITMWLERDPRDLEVEVEGGFRRPSGDGRSCPRDPARFEDVEAHEIGTKELVALTPEEEVEAVRLMMERARDDY